MKAQLLNKLQSRKNGSEKGFTIVELLIVIVVIGILAAIVIVAYNGVQNRAKATKAKAAGSALVAKLEAYVADGNTGTYPVNFGTELTGTGATGKSWQVTGLTISGTAITAAPAAGSEATVNYATCGTNGGARVAYWDYGASTPAIAYLYTGGASASSTCTLVTT